MKPRLAWNYAVLAMAAALLFGSSRSATAAPLLQGHQIRVDYLFPDAGSVYNTRDVTVGSGVETSFFTGQTTFDVDLADSQVALNNFRFASTFTPSSFNGLRFYDYTGTIDAFTGFSIASTNMIGLDSSRLSFDANNLYVNWQGLNFDTNTFVNLDVNGASSPVPEPATMTLFGMGAFGLIARYRRSREALL